MVSSIPRSSHDSGQLWPIACRRRRAVDNLSAAKPGDRIRRAHSLARSVAAPLDFDFALGESLGAHHDLPWNADQVGGGEFCAGTLVGVVIEDVDPFGGQIAIQPFT